MQISVAEPPCCKIGIEGEAWRVKKIKDPGEANSKREEEEEPIGERKRLKTEPNFKREEKN